MPGITHPCALLFCTEQHLDTAKHLATLCEQKGLTAHICEGGLTQSEALFRLVKQSGQQIALVVQGGGPLLHRSALASTMEEIESTWRSVCLTGAVIGQQAIAEMLPQRQGTLIYLGHAAATERMSGSAAYGAASAGLRSMAQSMAREFGPKGLHVAHVLLHGDMDGNMQPDPQDTALACWHLHQQHESTWTHELDLKRKNI